VKPKSRGHMQRARVRLRMAGCERGEEWGQCKRVWSSLPTILMGTTALVIGGVCVVIGKMKVRLDTTCGLGLEAEPSRGS